MTTTQHRRVLLAALPVTERRLTLAGASTTLLEGGHGPPVVLLHGGIEIGGAYWAPVIPALAQRHRLVVPDVPGLGESEPVDRLDEATFADWFVSLLERTCDEPPVLIAHSLLGSFAARFAARRGHLLRGLMIYGAPGIGRYRMPLGLMLAAILFDLRPSRRTQARFLPWAFHDVPATRRQHPEWFEAFDDYCVARGRVRHVKRAMRGLIGIGTRRIPVEELRRIPIPAVLLWGRHDRMAPLGLAATAAAELGWRLRVIEDAGHAPHLERPDAFLQAVTAQLGEPALVRGGMQ